MVINLKFSKRNDKFKILKWAPLVPYLLKWGSLASNEVHVWPFVIEKQAHYHSRLYQILNWHQWQTRTSHRNFAAEISQGSAVVLSAVLGGCGC